MCKKLKSVERAEEDACAALDDCEKPNKVRCVPARTRTLPHCVGARLRAQIDCANDDDFFLEFNCNAIDVRLARGGSRWSRIDPCAPPPPSRSA